MGYAYVRQVGGECTAQTASLCTLGIGLGHKQICALNTNSCNKNSLPPLYTHTHTYTTCCRGAAHPHHAQWWTFNPLCTLASQAGTPYEESQEGTQYVVGLSVPAKSGKLRMAAWAVTSTSLIAKVCHFHWPIVRTPAGLQ